MNEVICRRVVLVLLVVAEAATAQHPSGALRGGPPEAAFSACSGSSSGESCRFSAPHGQVRGRCRHMREPRLVCVPEGDAGMSPPPAADNLPHGGAAMGSRPVPVHMASVNPSARRVRSRLPDTGQGSCFDDHRLIPCPAREPFAGQDADYLGAAPAYHANGDGTVTDEVTGLTWQQGHNVERLDYPGAVRFCAQLQLGSHADWRLPSIRELFSLADFAGATGLRTFINPVFDLRPPEVLPDGDRFAASHRPDMMGQTWSSTIYRGDHWDRPGVEAAFFFNFLDGRIKQAPTAAGGPGLFYRCVRGEPWGDNAFMDNGDGTVTDQSFGLMWQRTDDGRARQWRNALTYCRSLRLAGKRDWRLPNAKELQSIVDYRRAAPAIDTSVFRILDPQGWFWSSTTHGEQASEAVYVCFGKCTSVDGVDVHGAGAQRSDPKTGEASAYRGGRGGQRDEVRIRNYARCVRSID